MSSAEDQSKRCVVRNGEALPVDAGSADEICAAIEAAASSLAPAADYTVEVRVLSSSSLAATVRLATGQVLPERKLAISDRTLNRSAVRHFAKGIGEQIARAGQRGRNEI